jgi:hypothetical protein
LRLRLKLTAIALPLPAFDVSVAVKGLSQATAVFAENKGLRGGLGRAAACPTQVGPQPGGVAEARAATPDSKNQNEIPA